ncbi:MAG: DUF2391 family protein [Arenicellales bacterium]|nr:DUF2391 family protein [Arenicellales bacterium]
MHKIQRRFSNKDISEWFAGSILLAFPVAMTEEAWNLGKELPALSILLIAVLSLVFIAWFGYHRHYQSSLDTHSLEFVIRVFSGYAIALIVAAFVLALLNQFPLGSEPAVAIKRMVLVAAPASAAGTIVDSMK